MIALTGDPLDVGAVLSAVGAPEHGGNALFIGTTRAENSMREVVAIDYEAAEPLATRELERIADEARARFGARVALVHRTGRVAVAEASVIVAASAGHRDAAFAATRYLIDELKSRAPIWKRLIFADGTSDWLDGRDA